MRLIDDRDANGPDLNAVRQFVAVDGRRISAIPGKDIAKTAFQGCQRIDAGITRYRSAHGVKHLPQIIDAMAVIGVIVRPNDGIERDDIGSQQLSAQIWRGIDENTCPVMLDQKRGARAAIARIFGVAGTPVVTDARNT